MGNEQKKSLMEGYVGVKFRTVQISDTLPPEISDLFESFKRSCDRLREHDMTPANGGNLSVRFRDGFVISSSGCNLGCIENNELIFVDYCDPETEFVSYKGPVKPSSESIMHGLIYQHRPEAQAIIHAHDEFATRPELLEGEIEESEREEPYGTVELAQMAISTFQRAESIIVLKNHGYVAVGDDLDSACDLIIDTHLKLISKTRGL